MQSRFLEREVRLEAERRVKYIGTARIRLEVLDFKWDEPRELSRKNVERVKGIFGGEKSSYENVRRLDPRNRIPAVVEQFDLNYAILASEVSAERLLSNPDGDPPFLKFAAGYRLTCLHGRHRIQAAREVLPPIDAWWAVDLYLADANPELRTTLVEEYSNEEKPSDGEIYRKVRQYEREGNICFKKRWKAHLSDHGRRALRQLCDHGEGEFVAAFDNLLDISGLWDGMRISTLHKMLELKCDQEGIHYLEHIRKSFYRIFKRVLREDKNALQRVDQPTVKAFECKAPGSSKRDAQVLQGQVLSGQICSLFSKEEREAIWSELRSIDYLIPSLFTFFEDLKYLRACADCLKRLVKVSRGDTVRSALIRKFPYVEEAGDQYVVEVAESTFVDRSGRAVDRFDIGYRHLWLFSMRDYRKVPPDVKKKSKNLLAKAGVQRADEEVLSKAADLADRLGFVSDEIKALKKRSPDREIARNALLKARKPDRYQYDQAVLEANVAQIIRLFTTATPLPSEYSKPALVCDNPDAAGKRCGFPDKDSQQQDREHLFIPHLHREIEEQGEEITSFFVRRSVYLAFFGQSADLSIDSGPDLPRPPQTHAQRTGPSSAQGLDMDGIERSRRQRLERDTLERTEAERRERQEQERVEQERLEQERLEQERLEQERVELRRMEETLEREELQERLAEAFQSRQNLELEKQRQQEIETQEVQRQEEEKKRQVTREQGRREQETIVENTEGTRKRHTQIDIQSIDGARQGFTSRKIVVADQSLDTSHPMRTLVTGRSGGQQDNSEQERLEQERLEQERLEQERLEQERLEQERLEQERLEQERLEQERLEQERLEQDRLEQERLEQERLEQERLEQEKERSRLEQERLEHERLEAKRLEQEGLEHERKRNTQIDIENIISTAVQEHQRAQADDFSEQRTTDSNLQPGREQVAADLSLERGERREQERLADKRLEQEKHDRETVERQKLQERAQRLQEQDKLERDKREQQKRELDRREAERQRQEMRDQRRYEQDTVESEEDLPAGSHRNRSRRRQDPIPQAQTPDSVCIMFKIRERGVWRTSKSLHVHSSDPSEVERVAVKYMRKQIRVYDTDLNILTPQLCFQAAITNQHNMLILIPKNETYINEELEASVCQLLSDLDSEMDAGIE